MKLTSDTLSGFRDELMKIAGIGSSLKQFAKAVPGQVSSAVRTGWNESGGWMGDGKLTSKLPIGGKALTLMGAASQLPNALAQEDPSGQGRSRAERVTGAAGNVLGGLAATGALMRTGVGRSLMATHPLLTNVAAGVGGGVLGEKFLASPFSHARKTEQQRQYNNMLTHPDPQIGYGEPGYYGRA